MDSKLYAAVSLGHYDDFLSLIHADPSLLCQTTVLKNTTLHVAAAFNQRQIVEEITQRRPSILYTTNSEEDTALHLAARLGSLEAAEHLIELAATNDNLEVGDQYKELMTMVNLKEDTALHDAVRNGHNEVAKLLVEKCPDLAAKANKSGESPLFLVVEEDNLDIAFQILEKNSNCSYAGRDGANVLHAIIIRALKRSSTITRFWNTLFASLWSSGIKYNVRNVLSDEFGKSRPLEKKITQPSPTHIDFIRKLVDKFPSIIREADIYGWLPLHYAANLGSSKEVVELILKELPSMAYEKDKNGMSALHIAAKEGHVGVLVTIVSLCPDSCEVLDVKGRTTLHVAVANEKYHAVRTMLKIPNFMKMVNQQDMDGNTALHLAAINGDLDLTITLASTERVAVNIVNNQGCTTKDIIRLFPARNPFLKLLVLRKLGVRGAVQGMRQVLTRKPITISGDGLKNSDSEKQNLVEKEKATELETDAVAETTRQQKKNKSETWKDWSDANLVVVALIATVTFSAVFQIPGGYDDDGMAVLRKRNIFRYYLICNALSFGFAVASIFLTFLAGPVGAIKHFIPINWVKQVTTMSFILMVLTFSIGMGLVMDENSSFSSLLIFLSYFSFEFPSCLCLYFVLFKRERNVMS